MKKRVRIFSCLLVAGILWFHGMSVWAVENRDSEDLAVTAFSYEEEPEEAGKDGQPEEIFSEDAQVLRQMELSEERADMLAEKGIPGTSSEAVISIAVILLGSCLFALVLWLVCRQINQPGQKRTKEKSKREKRKKKT